MRHFDARNTTGLQVNTSELVIATVAGQIAHPVGRANPYRIGQDGVPRILPATGGISINQRIGDRCVGIAGDHVEPGVALHNNQREVIGPRDGPNNALITYACIGNRVRVSSGACTGQWGYVTGKHGGVNHVLVDFPTRVLARLNIGDRMQIHTCGLGLRLLQHASIATFNCSPTLLGRWGIVSQAGVLHVPVTHWIPAAIMGSGLGKNTVWRGDYDIQLFDAEIRRRYRLGSLRYGDFIAILNADTRYGPSFKRGQISIGVIVHSDSTVSGHGPGVTILLSGPAASLRPVYSAHANLAYALAIRTPAPARNHVPLAGRNSAPASDMGYPTLPARTRYHLRLPQRRSPNFF